MTTTCPNCMGAGLRASGYCNRANVDGRGVVFSNCAACEGTGVIDWVELAHQRPTGRSRTVFMQHRAVVNSADPEDDELARYERWKSMMEASSE